jgi:Concanavalin A-like lectin/glucanases superfamily/PEP-CTERM motif
MRTKRRSCLMVLVLIGAVVAVTTNVGPCHASLVAWWNLDDGAGLTAADGSLTPAGGSPNDGTLVNYTGPAPVEWNMNLSGATDGVTMPHGLYFSGGANDSAIGVHDSAAQYVNLNAHAMDFSSLSAGTISVWMRRDMGANPEDHSAIGWGLPGNANAYYRVHIENASGISSASPTQYRGTHNNGSVTTEMGAAFVDDGNWHHVALTSDGVSSALYVDGTQQATGTLEFLDVVAWTQMSIGNTPRNDRNLWFFKGTLGDIRIYDEVLSQPQIAYMSDPAHYGDGLAVPEPATWIVALSALAGLAFVAGRPARRCPGPAIVG